MHFDYVGIDLRRPECVLTNSAGDVFVSDWRGGVTHIHRDGQQVFYRGKEVDGISLKPNGIALLPDGSFLIAHLGDSTGGIFRLERNGNVTPVVRRVESNDFLPTNFVALDDLGRMWISVSTRRADRSESFRANVGDGFIVLADDRGARIVADGLGFANECVIDLKTSSLYVNETFDRRIKRYEIAVDGSLGPPTVLTELGFGCFPDGLTPDVDGNLWVTSIVSNRLIKVEVRTGRSEIFFEDGDVDFIKKVERAYVSSSMGRQHLSSVKSRELKNISSLAFGGTDLRTAYFGCLLGDKLPILKRMPVEGRKPVHWDVS